MTTPSPGAAGISCPESVPCLYFGRVMHKRLRPFRHRFEYRVVSLWLDIDAIKATAAGLRLFSCNRFNLFGFHDSDHGRRDGSPLRPWVEELLAERGIDLAGGSNCCAFRGCWAMFSIRLACTSVVMPMVGCVRWSTR